MTISTSRATAQPSHIPDEHILVVRREALFPNGVWQGISRIDCDEYLGIIQDNKEFLPRALMEEDPRYKQIIPYLVFTHDNKYFLMQRHATASEKRLQNKYSLGIGGHIRQEDLTEGATITDWAQREFHEEVIYSGALKVLPLGILNDDSTPVGQVHIGFVFLLQGDTSHISVQSELKSGTLYTLEELKQFYPTMENWSQIVYDALCSHPVNHHVHP